MTPDLPAAPVASAAVSVRMTPEFTRPRHSEQRKGQHSKRKNEKSQRVRPRKWPRGVAIGLATIGILLGMFIGGLVLYAHWRFSQIKKDHVAHLAARPVGQPFDVLLVGSDSRAFVDTSAEAAQFGDSAGVSGQRSDVIIVARVVPATHQVKLLSIPRDTWVDIPGTTDISGPDRINAAFNTGPSLLVQTIENSFHIPISDFAEVNFPGFSGMVNALGGIDLDFRYLVKDAYSGLNISHTGCQLIHGTQALALVRSRHLYYEEDGSWIADPGSDWSRIQRQDAFFRAVLSKVRGLIKSPIGLNDFLGAATKNITIDQTLSEGELIHLANVFHSFSSANLATETLPTIPYTTSAGADVLLPAQAPDERMITKFLAFGTKPATPHKAAGANHGAGTNADLTATTTGGSTPSTDPTVTTIISTPEPSSAVVYNTASEPWNPTPCSL